ncbi:MAG: LLM class flavin-dependent oxidoreductase [Rhodospirillaceae bacterium]
MVLRHQTPIYGPNKFRLGLFGLNCSGGLTMSKVPERWDASWENNLKAATLADQAGIEFLLPIGRWHGYKGQTDTAGASFETLSWACGILAATQKINVFGTVHVSLINPVFAANQMVTADLIGSGRFGLNIVAGWNIAEHEMFGVQIKDHDERYDFAEEWLSLVNKLWSEREPFDFTGKYFRLKGLICKPKPWRDTTPMIISAGNSPAGRAFAARYADGLFTSIREIQDLPQKVSDLRSVKGKRGAGIYASGHLICRPTRSEAEDYYHYLVYENGDWEAAEHTVKIRTKGGSTSGPQLAKMKEAIISGTGTFPIIGSYDDAVDRFKQLSQSGLDGIAIGLVNFIDDMEWVSGEILPRLKKIGLRE